MGTQQITLLVIGLIVIGVAVPLGYSMFHDNAVSSARDALTADLITLADHAQAYYRRQKMFGGGGNSFNEITIEDLTQSPENENGRYFISDNSSSQIAITGVGKEVVGSDSIRALITVAVDSIALTVIN